MIGSLLGGLTKAVTEYTKNKSKATSTTKNTSNTGFTSPTTYQNLLGGKNATNEHADYINNTYSGGLDAYTKLQNDRYASAIKNNDVDLLNKLNADAQRVGYSLNAPQQMQIPQLQIPELDLPEYRPFNYKDFSYQDFNYDVNKDELYKKYAEMFARQGQSASENALASAASATGGMPSSFAAAANAQAQQAYAKKTADMVPALEQYAYDKYANDRNFNYQNYLKNFNTAFQDHTNKYNYDLNAAQSEYNALVNKQNALYNSAWDNINYTDSRGDLAYDRGKQQEAFYYQKYLDSLDQEYRQSQFDWNKQQDQIKNSISWDDNARQWQQFNYNKEQDQINRNEEKNRQNMEINYPNTVMGQLEAREKAASEQDRMDTMNAALRDAAKAKNINQWLLENQVALKQAGIYEEFLKELKTYGIMQ